MTYASKSSKFAKLVFSLPLYPAQAGGKFAAGSFVMRHTRTAFSVTRTIFGARTIDVIVWTSFKSYLVLGL